MTRSSDEIRNWQAVQAEVLRRLHTRQWRPGELIPNEAELAREFGCARATVNRALRALAEAGLLDRRRKAGTRVALHPVRKATLDISIVRIEVEGRGQSYDYRLLSRDELPAPEPLRVRLKLGDGAPLLHLRALHLADGNGHMVEDRWINAAAVPAIRDADLSRISANEWLVMHASFSEGDIGFSAASASADEARLLGCDAGAALFVIDRTTWNRDLAITSARLAFAPGYRMQTVI